MASRAEKLLNKGRSLESKGKLEKALAHYRDACKEEPYDPDLWMARADLAQRLGFPAEAAEALFRVGDLFARAGMPSEALKAVRRVLQLDHDHAGARRFARMLEARLGEPEAEPEAKPEAKPEPRPEPRPEAKPEAKPEPRVDVRAEPPPTAHATPEPSPPRPESTPESPSPAPASAEPATIHIEADEPEPGAIWTAPAPYGAPSSPLVDAIASVPAASPAAVSTPAPAPAASTPAPAATSAPAAASPRPDPTDGGVAAEFAIGATTGEMALDSISLATRLPSRPAGDSSEIAIDDDGGFDVVQAVASTLSSSPLLSELDSDLVKRLIDCGRLVHRTAGEIVFRQGAVGTSLFLVLEGEVVVQKEAAPGSPPRELARLRSGAFFGEMAVLTNSARTATVRTTRATHLLEVSRRDLLELIDREPRVLRLLMRFFRARLVGTLLQTSPLFKPFSRDEKRQLVARFRLRELGPHRVVVEEGVKSEGLFIVLAGRFQVVKSGGVVLAMVGPGDVFGEMSLLDDAPAMATVRSLMRSWVLLLPRNDVRELVAAHPSLRAHLANVANERRARNRAATDPGRAPTSDGVVTPVAMPEERIEPV